SSTGTATRSSTRRAPASRSSAPAHSDPGATTDLHHHRSMANEPLHVGIELAAAGIRVVASTGQRITISGARSQEPGEWLELALYGLSGGPGPGYATVAAPVAMSAQERAEIVRAGRGARFEGIFVCSAPHALARGVERQEGCVAIVVDPESTSVALV